MRIAKAAASAEKAGIAKCLVMREGDADNLPEPEHYLPVLKELRERQGKDTSENTLHQLISNPIAHAALAVKAGDADGIVAGASTASAMVIRPFLQILGTASGNSLASSVFFMCFPDHTLLFADCAVNISPSAEQRAEIALQTAATAHAFGIEPRVAMLSFVTGDSADKDAAAEARDIVAIVKERKPGLAIDGPLQYDAAVDPAIAKCKAPESLVAGKATVLIFPDLNAGNIAYKAVQQSTGITCIGPVLQGLDGAANDLSRGATVEDITGTIALTAVQARFI